MTESDTVHSKRVNKFILGAECMAETRGRG